MQVEICLAGIVFSRRASIESICYILYIMISSVTSIIVCKYTIIVVLLNGL